MPSQTRDLIREFLREDGPLTVDELVGRLQARHALQSKNPKGTVRNVLAGDPLCQSSGEKGYVYLPDFIQGACVRVPMDLVAPAQRLLAVGSEVMALLAPSTGPYREAPAPTLALDGGPEVTVEWKNYSWRLSIRTIIGLPPPFWRWWAARQRDGADALLICCDDGEAGRYSVAAVAASSLDKDTVSARNARVREAAVNILKRPHDLWPDDLARRLLAHGVYHGEPAPDPIAIVLFGPDEPFYAERMRVTYRPGLSPTLRRLFAPRLLEEQVMSENLVRETLGLPLHKLPQPDAPPPMSGPAQLVRVKVRLAWDRRIWRVIELLDDETLEDLHLAIQDVFKWDNDHLYAFFMSGQVWDEVTEIAGPFGDAEPPTSDEVTLAELDLRPKQVFRYLFDFGDQLEHEIEVLDIVPAPADGVVSRIVESHGEAPPQYPNWEEWDDDALGEDEEDEDDLEGDDE